MSASASRHRLVAHIHTSVNIFIRMCIDILCMREYYLPTPKRETDMNASYQITRSAETDFAAFIRSAPQSDVDAFYAWCLNMAHPMNAKYFAKYQWSLTVPA